MKTPKQDQAVRIVSQVFDDVAPSMLAVADLLGPSRKYAYATIHRAINAGRLRLDPDHPKASKRGRGALVWADDVEERNAPSAPFYWGDDVAERAD